MDYFIDVSDMEHQCDCGSIHNEAELGVQYNLYKKIDKDNVECLNEYEENSGVTVFKPWEERLDTSKVNFINIYFNWML